MTPIDQKIVSVGRGDCHRAVIASLLDLELDQVPHFRLFDDNWFSVYRYFMYSLGWDFCGSGRKGRRELLSEDSINGYFYAIVPSKTFGNGTTHAVVIDLDGVVVHDPNPNKLWQGINVYESGEINSWHMFDRVEN